MQTDKWKDYELIATGNGEKLERWGDVILLGPTLRLYGPLPSTSRAITV